METSYSLAAGPEKADSGVGIIKMHFETMPKRDETG